MAAGADTPLTDVQGDTIELRIELQPQEGVKRCGVKVRRSPGGEEQTPVYYDAAAKKLVIDTGMSSSSGEGSPAAAPRMIGVEPKNVEAGPFELQPGETLVLRVYVDKSVVEAFAGDRQAVMRHAYPARSDSLGVSVFRGRRNESQEGPGLANDPVDAILRSQRTLDGAEHPWTRSVFAASSRRCAAAAWTRCCCGCLKISS